MNSYDLCLRLKKKLPIAPVTFCVCVTSKQLTVRSFFHIVRTFVQLHKKKAREAKLTDRFGQDNREGCHSLNHSDRTNWIISIEKLMNDVIWRKISREKIIHRG